MSKPNKYERPLTPKQIKFAELVASHGDKSKAYKAVYSTKGMNDRTMWTEACKLSQNPKVSQKIEEYKRKIKKIAETKFNITQEEILRHLNILRQARIDEFVEFVEIEIPKTVTTGTGKSKTTVTTLEKRTELRFKTFDKLTEDQKMCIESIKQNRYGEIELKLHGKEWTIEKINKHIGFYERDNEQKKSTVILNEIERKEKIERLMIKASKLNK